MATTGTPRRPSPTGAPNGTRGAAPPPTRPTAPGRKGKPAPRRRTVWQKIKRFFLVVGVLALISLLTLMVWIATILKSAPTSIDLAWDPPGITYIYSSDGVPLAKLFVENRKQVPLSKIPKNLQAATIAFEDKRFYEHGGVDWKGVFRALGRNIKSRDLHGQGGSTITQQLARNMGVEGLTREKSVARKIHEWIIARQIENSYTKNDILSMYLNEVNYGSGAYGVQAAAQTYYGKDVDKLDLSECALLAGLPNRPTEFNPYKNKKAAKEQRDRVLTEMRDQGKITPAQFKHAGNEGIHLAGLKAPLQGSQILHAPYFVDYTIKQLQKKYGNDYLLRGNLQVTTTLNWEMQQQAEAAVADGIAASRRRFGDRGPTQAALVALDPKTGEIKAMVGGVSYQDDQFNIATQSHRQPGSSFKAVVYSAAIDSGWVTEQTRVLDAPVTYPTGAGPWTPQDDNGYSYEKVDLRTAMAYSINVPAVKVLDKLGPETAVHYAHLMGVDSPLDPVLSLALGSSGVSPLEMADVYATIAAGGNHPIPAAWTKLAKANGETIEDVPPAIETHVLQPDTVKQVDDMLRAVVEEPRGTGHVVADIPEARGKTGTTQGHKDVWFVGYTKNPDLVCAVWAGHPIHKVKHFGKKTVISDAYGEPMEGTAWGATVCAPIWHNFMVHAIPVFKSAQVRQAAREKSERAAHKVNPKEFNDPSVPSIKTTVSTSGDSSTSSDQSDTGITPPPPPPSANADGSTTTNVDNNTGLLAPTGSPNSHTETFDHGAAPTVMSPQYGNSPSAPSPPAQPAAPETPHAQIRPIDSSPAPPPVRYVTVQINPDDGLLATKWCPQSVPRTFVRGQEPRRYSRMYGPPEGEQ